MEGILPFFNFGCQSQTTAQGEGGKFQSSFVFNVIIGGDDLQFDL